MPVNKVPSLGFYGSGSIFDSGSVSGSASSSALCCIGCAVNLTSPSRRLCLITGYILGLAHVSLFVMKFFVFFLPQRAEYRRKNTETHPKILYVSNKNFYQKDLVK